MTPDEQRDNPSRIDPSPFEPLRPPPTPTAPVPPDSAVVAPLTPEEQMALFEKELKENDWGHQPC